MNPKAIKEAREAQGLSLRELADKSGVSFSTISRVENGKEAKHSVMLKLYEALGLGTPIMELSEAELMLLAAWRDGDYGLMLRMIAEQLGDV